jgi:mannose-6-phosphate isomerase
MVSSVFQLQAFAQRYAWGKPGNSSKVAEYLKSASNVDIVETDPYAELWMGTHSTLPSRLHSTGALLSEHLEANPQLLGEKVITYFGGKRDLPFLFKVLAIKDALSIQAHPNRTLAQQLHRERPDLYKDDNHKPEMAIALTPFRGLCGFRPLEEIAEFLQSVPELQEVVGSEAAQQLIGALSVDSAEAKKASLKRSFELLMTSNPERVRAAIQKLTARYQQGKLGEKEKPLDELVLELNGQFPDDVGVLCVFFLNVVNLAPNQAMFLGADEPHAYISGDITECMATSDNVVRAGLTPKHRDVSTLVSMLTYNYGKHQPLFPTPFPGCKHSTLYNPPIEEFSVIVTSLEAEGLEEEVRPIDGPSILIVTRGSGMMYSGDGLELKEEVNVKEGVVFFIGAATGIKFVSGPGGLAVHRAFVTVV